MVSHWPQLTALRLNDEFHSPTSLMPVHGDLNPSNVHLPRRDGCCIKVVDWEWGGIGLPQADLAALLNGVSPEVERRALEAFHRSDGQLSAEAHHRRFQWCKLERGLLDAGFLAAMALGGSDPARFRCGSRIERAGSRVLQAFRELQ